ncbi:TGS domain-containing protein [bacterium]|nr:TGS domain-containing protein [bacterium]
MPANLPPEYFSVEKEYRDARTVSEKIAMLEKLIGTIPKHKGTDHLRADLRRKMSKLKSAAQSKKKISKQESAFHIEKEGSGQVAVIGLANVGKSTFLNALTNATPEVAGFPFSTWVPTPGMLEMKNIQVQLIDTPPLNRDYLEPELMDLIRRVDLILILLDIQTRPIKQYDDTIKVLLEHKIVPETLRGEYSTDEVITYVPTLIVVNKDDDQTLDDEFNAFKALISDKWDCVSVSLKYERNFEQLKDLIYNKLQIIRVYSKPPGEEPDYTAPFVLQKGGTVEEFAGKIHQDFYKNLKSARVWGEGVYDGQMVGRDHVLHEGDVIELKT